MPYLRRMSFKSLFLILMFMIMFIYPTNINAKKNVLEIEKLFTDLIDRTWDDLTLLYDNHFHNSSQVQEEIDRFHTLVPELIDMEVIGQTFWGKNITSLCITNELRTHQKAKTLVVSHHHGREQITVETALRFILYLLNSYGVNDTITKFIDTQEIYVIPSLNLDALDLVVDGENYWLRKNIRPFDDDGDLYLDEDPLEDVNSDGVVSGFDVYTKSSGKIYYQYTYYEGIDNDMDGLINEDMVGYTDLNRNYDSYWRDGSGWSLDTQSEVFPGHAPFSEPETCAFRDFALNHSFAMCYSLHSGINATFFTDNEVGWTEPTLYWNMVRYEEAKTIFEEAFEIREKLLSIDLDNLHYQSDLAGTLNNLGELLRIRAFLNPRAWVSGLLSLLEGSSASPTFQKPITFSPPL